MRYIHPAAWAGLCLNFVLAYFLFSSLLGLDISVFEGQEREIWEAIRQTLLTIRPLYYGMLAIQAIALGLIALGIGFGLGLSFAASFLMLPGAIIYMVGCALSHYRVKYAAFAVAPRDYAGARFAFTAQVLRRTRVLTIAVMLTALACMLLDSLDIGLTLLGMGLAGVYCTLRAARHYALTLHDEYLTLSPALFAGRVLLPYKAIHRATLGDDEGIVFAVETPSGLRELRWSLRTVFPHERRAALEELAAALTAHHVPLY